MGRKGEGEVARLKLGVEGFEFCPPFPTFAAGWYGQGNGRDAVFVPCRRRNLIVIMTLGCLSCAVAASSPRRCHPPPLLRLESGKDKRCFPVSSGKGVYIDGGTKVLHKGEDLSEGGRRMTWRSLRLVLLLGLLKDVGIAGAIRKVSACGFRGDDCVCVTVGAGRGCSNAVDRFKGTWAGDTAELIILISMSLLLFVGRGFCSAWRISCSIALYVCKTRSPESEALTLAFVSPESRLGCFML